MFVFLECCVIKIHALSCTCGWCVAHVGKNLQMFDICMMWSHEHEAVTKVCASTNKFQLPATAAVCLFPLLSLQDVTDSFTASI